MFFISAPWLGRSSCIYPANIHIESNDMRKEKLLASRAALWTCLHVWQGMDHANWPLLKAIPAMVDAALLPRAKTSLHLHTFGRYSTINRMAPIAMASTTGSTALRALIQEHDWMHPFPSWREHRRQPTSWLDQGCQHWEWYCHRNRDVFGVYWSLITAKYVTSLPVLRWWNNDVRVCGRERHCWPL